MSIAHQPPKLPVAHRRRATGALAATGIRRYCPTTSTRMCLELHSGQLLGLLLERLLVPPALVFEWVLTLQAELMSVLVAPLQAELVLLPALVERLLPARAVGQMLVPRLSPEVMKALKLVAELHWLVAAAAH